MPSMFANTNTKIILGDYVQPYIDRTHNKTAPKNMQIKGLDRATYEVVKDGSVFETATGYELFKTNYYQTKPKLTAEIGDYLIAEKKAEATKRQEKKAARTPVDAPQSENQSQNSGPEYD